MNYINIHPAEWTRPGPRALVSTIAALALTACIVVDDDGEDDADHVMTGAQDGSMTMTTTTTTTTESGSTTDASTTTTASTTTDPGTTGTGDATATGSGTGSDTGELPLGDCGWDGSLYTCGAPGEMSKSCPDGIELGSFDCKGLEVFETCCDPRGHAWYCSPMVGMEQTVCGTCGWSGDVDTYACGGEGLDVSGVQPRDCPYELSVGAPCGDLEPFQGCCDLDGDNWWCSPMEGMQLELCPK